MCTRFYWGFLLFSPETSLTCLPTIIAGAGAGAGAGRVRELGPAGGRPGPRVPLHHPAQHTAARPRAAAPLLS